MGRIEVRKASVLWLGGGSQVGTMRQRGRERRESSRSPGNGGREGREAIPVIELGRRLGN